ncbi:predicted protein [Naegleria gruberi]|uniref:Predicted protein n=1 Tax=Naegleria gruberi TaxID=5762 RepID=D2VWI2_NAEGR|nr:uncharacterized protein NAEGRDRAFT_73389 [Naegleria gruberi]EFC38898.1 predicted protein [Naegleria gruberi]|eukprot:XP_002671642.1 predicted protein [Naegleria gruberi strain NEG-M]
MFQLLQDIDVVVLPFSKETVLSKNNFHAQLLKEKLGRRMLQANDRQFELERALLWFLDKLKEEKLATINSFHGNTINSCVPFRLVLLKLAKFGKPGIIRNLPFDYDDRQVLLECVRNCGSEFAFLPEKFKVDREIALAAVKSNADSIASFMVNSSVFRKDPEIIAHCLMANCSLSSQVSPEALDDEAFCLSVVERIYKPSDIYYVLLHSVSNRLLESEPFMKRIISKFPKALYAFKKFITQEDLVISCVERGLDWIHLKKDLITKDLILKCLQNVSIVGLSVFQKYRIPVEFEQDRDITIQQLKIGGKVWDSTIHPMFKLSNFILNDTTLFGGDIKLILDVLKHNADIFSWLPDHVQSHPALREFNTTQKKQSIEQEPSRYENIWNRDEFIDLFNKSSDDELERERLVCRCGYLLRFCSPKITANKEIVMRALQTSPMSLKYTSDELKKDKEVVLVAIRRNIRAIQFANLELLNDKDICNILAGGIDIIDITFPNQLFNRYVQVIRRLLVDPCSSYYPNEPEFLDYDGDESFSEVGHLGLISDTITQTNEVDNDDYYLNNREFYKFALRYDGTLLQYAPEEIRNDEQMICLAVSTRRSAFNYATEERKQDLLTFMRATKSMSFYCDSGEHEHYYSWSSIGPPCLPSDHFQSTIFDTYYYLNQDNPFL